MTYVWVKLSLVVIAGLVTLGKVAMEASTRSAQRRRMRSGQRELADNTAVTLIGTVKLVGEPLVAPLSGTPCVAYRSRARERSQGGYMGAMQDTLEWTRQRMTAFVLVTKEREVIVDGEEATLTVRPAPIIPRKIEREVEFMREVAPDFSPRSVSFDEVVITPGTRIAVHGLAQYSVVPGEAQFRDAPSEVRVVAHANHPLTIDLV